ncbi:hypothetical protein OUZ56_016518 [Daphnia magna]|uniref:Uncharacterized protein n=1 Tax=Daphnia magna TaxID=35525 RepID=A0ABR0AQS6_9CRUS|nr:hypothetical protein OUZ56_016518 [Daphnia magna]
MFLTSLILMGVPNKTWLCRFKTLFRRNTIFRRLLPTQYGNGIDSPRPATDGGELLNPRNISLSIVGDDGPNSTDITLLVMSFGQFVTHDITYSEDFNFEFFISSRTSLWTHCKRTYISIGSERSRVAVFNNMIEQGLVEEPVFPSGLAGILMPPRAEKLHLVDQTQIATLAKLLGFLLPEKLISNSKLMACRFPMKLRVPFVKADVK